MTKFEATVTMTFEVPERDSYDYEQYLRGARNMELVTHEELMQALTDEDHPVLDSFVIKAMIRDALERPYGGTAHQYGKSEPVVTARRI